MSDFSLKTLLFYFILKNPLKLSIFFVVWTSAYKTTCKFQKFYKPMFKASFYVFIIVFFDITFKKSKNLVFAVWWKFQPCFLFISLSKATKNTIYFNDRSTRRIRNHSLFFECNYITLNINIFCDKPPISRHSNFLMFQRIFFFLFLHKIVPKYHDSNN